MKELGVRRIVIDAHDLRLGLMSDEIEFRRQFYQYKKRGFEVVLSVPTKLPGDNHQTLNENIIELQKVLDLSDTIISGGPEERICGLHLDDKAITFEEFANLSYVEVSKLVKQL